MTDQRPGSSSSGRMFYVAYNQPMERVDGENDVLEPVVVAKVSYLFGLQGAAAPAGPSAVTGQGRRIRL